MVAEDIKAEITRENKKIRYLRFMADFALVYVANQAANREEAEKVVEDLKRTAVHLFPGKEDTFEIVYRPRFSRLIGERFPLVH
jgi:hypothetical protein